MPRFHALAECVGQALREHGRDALTGAAPVGDVLLLLPPRPPWCQPGDRPPGLSAWELLEPLGLDAATETWRARQHARPELPERLLTLFHDPALHPPFRDHLPVFEKAHALASVT